jgi:hypothetical protein
MREERLEVSVTFDERHGYIASAPELRSAVVALSLGGLRRKIEALLLQRARRRCRSESAIISCGRSPRISVASPPMTR